MMKRALLSIGLLLALGCAAGAQFSGQSCFGRGGFCTPAASGAAPYVGPGDLSVGSTLITYNGLRCITAAYSGNVADITDSATGNTTGTRLKCDGAGNVVALVSGSACTFVTGNACSTLATTCGTACNVSTLYDQVAGGTACNGGVCNLINTTNANRPTLTVSCQNSQPCMAFASANSQILTTGAIAVGTISQPYSISMALVTNSATTLQGAAGALGTSGSIYHNNVSGDYHINAGSDASVTGITEGQFIGLQTVFRDSVSAGTSILSWGAGGTSTPTSTLTTGTQAWGNAGNVERLGNDASSRGFWNGKMLEFGIWNGSLSTAQLNTLYQNQRTFWNF